MLQAILILINNFKGWFYGAVLLGIATFVGMFWFRGHEIEQLKHQVEIQKSDLEDADKTITIISQLREQEIKSHAEAEKRGAEIRSRPPSDNGPISPVLHDTLQRL